MQSKPHVQVATGLIFNDRNQILVSKRPPEKFLGGLWEFPGGKIEANESTAEALIRELEEEVNIRPTEYTPFELVVYEFSDRIVHLNTFVVTEFDGEAMGCENQEIDWVDQAKLHQLTFPASNQIIIKALDNQYYTRLTQESL